MAKVVALGHLAIEYVDSHKPLVHEVVGADLVSRSFGYPFDKRDVIEKPEPLTEQGAIERRFLRSVTDSSTHPLPHV